MKRSILKDMVVLFTAIAMIAILSNVSFAGKGGPQSQVTTLTTPLIFGLPTCTEANLGSSTLEITVTRCTNCMNDTVMSCDSWVDTVEPGNLTDPGVGPLEKCITTSAKVGLCQFTFTGSATDVHAGGISWTNGQFVPAQ